MKKNVTNLESIRECARVAFLYFTKQTFLRTGSAAFACDTLADMFFAIRNTPEKALEEGAMNAFAKALKIGGPVLVLDWIANCYDQFCECVEFRLRYEDDEK